MITLVLTAHAATGRLTRTADRDALRRSFVDDFLGSAGLPVDDNIHAGDPAGGIPLSAIAECKSRPSAGSSPSNSFFVGIEWCLHNAFLYDVADLVVILESHAPERPSEAELVPNDQAIMEKLFNGKRALVSAVMPVSAAAADQRLFWVCVSVDGSGTYAGEAGAHPEADYTRILRRLASVQRASIRPDRTGTGTISTFGEQLRFDISDHIPLVTTKRVNPASVIEELLFFLRGDTSSRVLEDRGVHIWRANTTREFLDARGLAGYAEGDMGPMYGYQWRHFGAQWPLRQGGVDQLAAVEELLKRDPYSRRIVLTTYNPADLDKMVLPPCHGLVCQFYVSDDPTAATAEAEATGSRRLSCHMYQRSVDVGLGLVWNILSYTVLTHLLAKRCGMQPHELVISTGDTHLYSNHVEQCRAQLRRAHRCAPMLVLCDSVKDKAWADLRAEDFSVCGYYPHPYIRMDMAV